MPSRLLCLISILGVIALQIAADATSQREVIVVNDSQETVTLRVYYPSGIRGDEDWDLRTLKRNQRLRIEVDSGLLFAGKIRIEVITSEGVYRHSGKGLDSKTSIHQINVSDIIPPMIRAHETRTRDWRMQENPMTLKPLLSKADRSDRGLASPVLVPDSANERLSQLFVVINSSESEYELSGSYVNVSGRRNPVHWIVAPYSVRTFEIRDPRVAKVCQELVRKHSRSAKTALVQCRDGWLVLIGEVEKNSPAAWYIAACNNTNRRVIFDIAYYTDDQGIRRRGAEFEVLPGQIARVPTVVATSIACGFKTDDGLVLSQPSPELRPDGIALFAFGPLHQERNSTLPQRSKSKPTQNSQRSGATVGSSPCSDDAVKAILAVAAAHQLKKSLEESDSPFWRVTALGPRLFRDTTIEDRVRRCLPDLSDFEVRALRRLICQLLDRQLSLERFSKATLKEELLELVKQKLGGEVQNSSVVVEFLVKLHEAMGSTGGP